MYCALSDDAKWALVGYVRSASNRHKVLKTLKTHFLIPTDIARINEMRLTQVSKELKNLKDKKLVECMNESATKGRIYKITPLGLEILEILERDHSKT